MRTIAALPELRLARVASANVETPDLMPPGCEVVDHWQKLLEPAAIDGLIIATPPASHAEIARSAIDVGIAVLVEKPLALSADDARTVRDLAMQKRVPVLVDHTHLFSPAFRALKDLVACHGGAREIRSEASNHGPYRRDVSVLWDWGPHDVAMCLDLMRQAPASAVCSVIESSHRGDGKAETVSVALSFPSGVPAEIRLSNTRDKARRFLVRCADGAHVLYDDTSAQKLRIDSSPIAVDVQPPLTVAVREFAAAIASGGTDQSGLDLAVRVVEVLQACNPIRQGALE